MASGDGGPDLALWQAIKHIIIHPASKTVFSIGIVLFAFVLIYLISREVHPSEIWADLKSARTSSILVALGLTILGFSCLSMMDVINMREVAPGTIPARIAAATCAASVAVSNCLGFAYLTGMTVRFRSYSRWGLDATRIGLLFALSWSAYSTGIGFIFGVMLVARPDVFSALVPVPEALLTAAGVVLLAGICVLVWALGHKKARALNVFGQTLSFPRRQAAFQLGVVVFADLCSAALVLYILMPSDLVPDYFAFLPIFLLAMAIGMLSHSPGGLGVFEAMIITAVGAHGRSDVLAALILYRTIYTFLPFLVAALAIAVFELRTRKQA